MGQVLVGVQAERLNDSTGTSTKCIMHAAEVPAKCSCTRRRVYLSLPAIFTTTKPCPTKNHTYLAIASKIMTHIRLPSSPRLQSPMTQC